MDGGSYGIGDNICVPHAGTLSMWSDGEESRLLPTRSYLNPSISKAHPYACNGLSSQWGLVTLCDVNNQLHNRPHVHASEILFGHCVVPNSNLCYTPLLSLSDGMTGRGIEWPWLSSKDSIDFHIYHQFPGYECLRFVYLLSSVNSSHLVKFNQFLK
jgi:hypothetical protein